jgi:hypothetical protein
MPDGHGAGWQRRGLDIATGKATISSFLLCRTMTGDESVDDVVGVDFACNRVTDCHRKA